MCESEQLHGSKTHTPCRKIEITLIDKANNDKEICKTRVNQWTTVLVFFLKKHS